MDKPTSPTKNSATGNAAGEQTSAVGNQSQSMGGKFKAAIQVIHGVGENIRGTALGAVDTAFSEEGSTRNEEIARKGRMDTEQGLAILRSPRSKPAASAGAPGEGHSGVESQQGQPTTAGTGSVGEGNGQQNHPYSQAEKSAVTGQPPKMSSSQRTSSGAPTRKFGADSEVGPVSSQDRGDSGQVADVGGSRGYHDAVTDVKGQPESNTV